MNKKLIIDSNNICHIVANALPDLTSDHDRTEVIYGFLTSIFKLQKQYNPDNLIFCWDSKKSFRKIIYPEYKANRRKDLTEEGKERLQIMFDQFTEIRTKVLPLLGFHNIFMSPGYEGDDIIAKISMGLPANHIIYIVSTDKDLYQLLRRNVTIINPITKKMVTKEAFIKKYEIDVTRWAEVKAIAGDVSDNISGVERVGETTAIKYLNGVLPEHHKTYKAIVSEEGVQIKERNLPLVTLPFVGKTSLITRLVKKKLLLREDFEDMFTDYGFGSFLKRVNFEQWVQAFDLK